MSDIGVRWHLSQQKKTQFAASEIAAFKKATKCSFLLNMSKKIILFTQFDCIKPKNFFEAIFFTYIMILEAIDFIK